MYISAPFGSTFIGLFGRTDGAILTDIEIVSSRIDGEAERVGGIVGHAENTCIERCSFSGALFGKVCVGGVAGELLGGSIESSAADCTAAAA